VVAIGQNLLNQKMTGTAASPRPSAARRRTGRIVFWAIFAAAAACLVAAFLWSRQTVGLFSDPSSSMEPTVQPGDEMLADLGSAARRGDVIILRLPSGFSAKIPTGGDYVKRVIGLPGDRVACCGSRGRVTVNGKPLNETYLYPGDPPSTAPFSVTLGSGQLWVLGDHRRDAVDSRIWGPVPQSDVVGRVEEINDRGSFRQVQTPQTFVGEGLAPPDGRTPTVLFPLGLGTPAALTLLGLTVFGIIRTVIRRRRRRRIREASASADASG
jgi:signal peptidase I